MVIYANKLIETGFSLDDAQKLFDCIHEKIECAEKIIIDFDKVKFFTTQFFNNSISKFVLSLGPEEFKRRISIVNLSEVGQSTYEHSYDNAVAYFKLPVDKRLKHNLIVDQDEDDE